MQELSELQKAGVALKTLRGRLQDLEGRLHEPVAVVGLGCRFPGQADTPDSFWSLLVRGEDAVREVPAWRWNKDAVFDARPGTPGKIYTLDAGWLEDVDRFDAAFFGIAPKEAISMDPQHRILLETAWTALEEAGESVDRLSGARVGVFLGVTSMDYAQQTIQSGRPELLNGFYTTGVTFNGGAGRVAYTFGFTGPCMAVDTACSSSLVALHLAVRSLRGGECEMALAAGVNVNLFVGNSVSMCEARLISPSGRCRTFDASADGMVRGEGCGVVVLKRLSDALRDGNHIHAIIRGTAVNQDGASSSLAAPNGRAQEAVIRAALADARVKSTDIDFVEAHGSATPLGDPIEIRALGAVYGSERSAENPLLVGAVKSNIGHLESAAGMAGFFKVVQCLAHERLVRQLHFSQPNPEVDWERVNVRVCAEDRPWPRGERPRRAAVSGFGVSGTNAHIILEEAPLPRPSDEGRSAHVIALSAPTASGLETVTRQLVDHLASNPDLPFPDVAYTLQVGRAPFAFRRALVCSTREEALRLLKELDPARVVTRQISKGQKRPLVFMFPGTGEHYANMGRDLFEKEPVFREELLRCSGLLREALGCDLIELLYGASEPVRASEPRIDFAAMVRGETSSEGPLSRTLYAHAAVFAIEYALGRQLMAWGLEPQLLIGYSTGEYVAACLASVMTLEDALRVLTERARLIEQQPEGAMLSVLASETELAPHLTDGLWLAASNGPELCVLAGTEARIRRAQDELQAAGFACRRVGVRHAFHSPLIAGIEQPFLELLRGLRFESPKIPIVSNVTGARLSDAEARDPSYWYRHAVSPVRFAEGIAVVWSRPERVLLEVGPGQVLTGLALQHGERDDGRIAIATLRSRYESHSDVAFLQSSLAKLWLSGVQLSWAALYDRQARQKLALPTYAFERQRFWIEADQRLAEASPARSSETLEKPPLPRWFYVPEWRRSTLYSAPGAPARELPEGAWLLFGDARGLADRLERALRDGGRRVVRATSGTTFNATDDEHVVLDTSQAEHFGLLVHHLRSRGISIRNVVYLASGAPASGHPSTARAALVSERGFYGVLRLVQAFGETPLEEGLRLAAITTGGECVLGDDLTTPEHAVMDGILRVAPQEFKGLRCARIDLPEPTSDELAETRFARSILSEFAAGLPEASVAHRGSARWVRDFHPMPLEAPTSEAVRLRSGGVYVLTGGLGGIGRTVAAHLAACCAPKLVFVTRTAPPPESEWDAVLARGASDPDYEKVRLLRELGEAGVASLCVSADVADEASLARALSEARARFGAINGIFHCAGVPGAGLILTKRREACESVFAPKLAGALNLAALCRRDALDFVVYFSSVAALHGAIGQADYAGANAFLDAFAQYQRQTGVPAISIDWGMWQFDAWQDKLTAALPQVQKYLRERRERLGIALDEGMLALDRALALDAPQLVISTISPDELARAHADLQLESIEPTTATSSHGRPASLQSEFVEPTTDTERALVEIWSQALGIDRIGIVDDFFELGGHSLLGTRIMTEVARRFGTTLPLRVLFAGPTVEKLAAAIEDQILADIAAMPDEADASDAAPESGIETIHAEALPPSDEATHTGEPIRK